MSLLSKEHAPITAAAWRAVEDECKAALALNLAARKLVDLDGPHGWSHGAASTGRTEPLKAGALGDVEARRMRVLPLVELEVRFAIARAELDALERGAKDVDLSEVVRAAQRIAHAEDRAVFHGYAQGGMTGIVDGSPHEPLTIEDGGANTPFAVVEAIETLREAGVEGPYAVALGPRSYTELFQASDPGGYPALKRLEQVLQGPVVRAPALEGAVVLSLRGGDFELCVGQDLALGYAMHSAEKVELRLLETIAFRLLSPEAAVPLAHAK